VAFAEMVISFKSADQLSGTGTGVPTLEAIQGVWKLTVVIGGVGAFLSWAGRRETKKVK